MKLMYIFVGKLIMYFNLKMGFIVDLKVNLR